eukprot:CAMPEP_0118712766 /NCGR_PEP_ID=MMETSP0800-20121206/25050_1 /TAXON_ID=210618 ORGANISM="Striatella unipunctata, Strain CCMP2910" /NCGR_SAMPLE_ID=MMETSP0800 /ASSEMBLY_ACC=CAM_ASM_000638 /LENGTH=64 /DNA_ID=CAMNT_0006617957 /DNA_START=90 /DNA_END=281 /DNA_ORIENTATION=+
MAKNGIVDIGFCHVHDGSTGPKTTRFYLFPVAWIMEHSNGVTPTHEFFDVWKERHEVPHHRNST